MINYFEVKLDREYFFRGCGYYLAKRVWDHVGYLDVYTRPDVNGVWKEIEEKDPNSLFPGVQITMSDTDYTSVYTGIREYYDENLFTIYFNTEYYAKNFWNEIFDRYDGGNDVIATILSIHIPFTCAYDEAKDIYEYSKKIPGFFSDDGESMALVFSRGNGGDE